MRLACSFDFGRKVTLTMGGHKRVVTADSTFGFGLRGMKNFPELLPLVSMIGGAFFLAALSVGYGLYHKSDVKLNKAAKRGEVSQWENFNPEEKQRLLTFNYKYERNRELENLRREIGSYKT